MHLESVAVKKHGVQKSEWLTRSEPWWLGGDGPGPVKRLSVGPGQGRGG